MPLTKANDVNSYDGGYVNDLVDAMKHEQDHDTEKRYRLSGKRAELYESDNDDAALDDLESIEKRYRVMGKRYRVMGKKWVDSSRSVDDSSNEDKALWEKRYRLTNGKRYRLGKRYRVMSG